MGHGMRDDPLRILRDFIAYDEPQKIRILAGRVRGRRRGFSRNASGDAAARETLYITSEKLAGYVIRVHHCSLPRADISRDRRSLAEQLQQGALWAGLQRQIRRCLQCDSTG